MRCNLTTRQIPLEHSHGFVFEQPFGNLCLQVAVEFVVGNTDGAKQALQDMPPRAEEELDPVKTSPHKYLILIAPKCPCTI